MKRILALIAMVICFTPVNAYRIIYGNNVVISQPVYEDLYIAGGNVTINAPVYGDLIIAGGTIVTGDGNTIIANGYLHIQDGRIVALGEGPAPARDAATVINASGQIVMPGMINTHAHGCTAGPLNPIGSTSLTGQQVRDQLDRHLIGGETTVLCVCGFCLPQSTALTKDHPVRVCQASSHTPANIRAADIVDGRGLEDRHRNTTVEKRRNCPRRPANAP